MIFHDFHGYELLQAIHEVDSIVGKVRNEQKTEHATFVTGHGIIREKILNLLEDVYGLDPRLQIGNNGTIIVTIE